MKELLIDVTPAGVTIGLLKDGQLIELHQEQNNNNYVVGDIYFGRVKKIIPSLNAAFIDVGHERDAFLHYLDLGPHFTSLLQLVKVQKSGANHVDLSQLSMQLDISKGGKIADLLTKNMVFPVQIVKEPISTKGPRLSADIALAGRYVVLVPFSNTLAISKKIRKIAECNRLKKLIKSIQPPNFGVIIRTVSEGKGAAELQADISDLMSKWANFSRKLKMAEPAEKLLGEVDRSSSILRDLLNDDFEGVHVNNQAVYEEVRAYIRSIAPEQERMAKFYKGKQSLFEHFGIDRQIKSLFGKTVTMQGGAYLIIEHTEALHVIDVNSGNRNGSGEDTQEGNALHVNTEAAKEIARQLRLRNMGGIIVVDFIDMRKVANRKILFDVLKKEMSEDRARHAILPPSKFGIVQITRQRVRPEMHIVTVEKCPGCQGTGEIKPSILLVEDIESQLKYLLTQQNESHLSLILHPYVAAFIQKGLLSKQMRWFFAYGKWIAIKVDFKFQITEYLFLNQAGDPISL